MEFLSKLCQAVLEASIPLIAVAIVTFISAKATEVFKRISAESPEAGYILQSVAMTAVTAAEQVFGSEKGIEKKQYAIAVMECYLKDKGLKIDLKIIDALVESAVKQLRDRGMEEDAADSEQSE